MKHKVVAAVMQRDARDVLRVVITCCGALGLVAGVTPGALGGAPGAFLVGVAAMLASKYIAVSSRAGKPKSRALATVLAASTLVFVLIFGCAWYFNGYLATHPEILSFVNLGYMQLLRR